MTKRISFMAVLIAFVFAACNQENELSTELTDTATTEAVLKMETFFDDVENEVDLRLEEKSGKWEGGKDEGLTKNDDCPILTWSAQPGTFPNTLVIDFGEDGCVSATGTIKSGQIVVNQSAPLAEPGAVRTVTLVNFTVNARQLEGTKTLTNNGPVGPGQRSFTRTITGGQITFLNGDVATKDATRTLTQLDGLGTDTFIDDIFAITGSTAGTNRNGVPYSVTILEPMIKERNCAWVIQGIREMTFGPFTRSIDFGNGVCDPFAVVTNANGQSATITMQP